MGHTFTHSSDYKRKKKEKKLRDVTSHIFAQTTHVALPPPKLSCGVGSQTKSTMPSFIKIGTGVLAPSGVEICHFPMLSAMAYITGQGYRPTCDRLDEWWIIPLMSYLIGSKGCYL